MSDLPPPAQAASPGNRPSTSISEGSEGPPSGGRRTRARSPGVVDPPFWAPGWFVQFTMGILGILSWWTEKYSMVVPLIVGYFVCSVIRRNSIYVIERIEDE